MLCAVLLLHRLQASTRFTSLLNGGTYTDAFGFRMINDTMQFKTSPSVVLLLLGASSSAIAKCIGPPVNQATLDLVKEFEGWIPGICELPVIESHCIQGTRRANVLPQTMIPLDCLPLATGTSAKTSPARTSHTESPCPGPMARSCSKQTSRCACLHPCCSSHTNVSNVSRPPSNASPWPPRRK